MFNSNIMMEPTIFGYDRMSFPFAEQDAAPFRVNAGARLFCPPGEACGGKQASGRRFDFPPQDELRLIPGR